MQMLTIADEGLFTTVFSFSELLLPTCLSVRECDGPAAKTRIHLLWFNTVPNMSQLFPVGGWGGGAIVLKVAEQVEHYPVVKKHCHVLFCFVVCSSDHCCKRISTYNIFLIIYILIFIFLPPINVKNMF